MPIIKNPKILLVRLLLCGLTVWSATKSYSMFQDGKDGAGLIHAGFTAIFFLCSLGDLEWLWQRRNTPLTELIDQRPPGEPSSYRFAVFLSYVLIILGIYIQSQ